MEKLNKSELAKIKAKLMHGDMQKIAKMSNRGIHTVRRFFRGDVYCFDVLEATLRLLEKRQTTYQKAKSLIS